MRRPIPPLAPVTRATRPLSTSFLLSKEMGEEALVAEPLEALLVGLALGVALGLALLFAVALAAVGCVLVHDADAAAERAVAAEAPELFGARHGLARHVVVAPARTAAPPTTATRSVVAGDHERLDLAHGRDRQPRPGGEHRVARLVPGGLLGAHRGPLHGLALGVLLRRERLAHDLRTADPIDRRLQSCLRAGG